MSRRAFEQARSVRDLARLPSFNDKDAYGLAEVVSKVEQLDGEMIAKAQALLRAELELLVGVVIDLREHVGPHDFGRTERLPGQHVRPCLELLEREGHAHFIEERFFHR